MRKTALIKHLSPTALLLFFAIPVLAAKTESNLFDLSLDELANIEIVTVGKVPEKIKDIPASVVLITRKDIKKYGYTTLTDVLENAPGLFNIYSYSGVSGNFGVRGFWNPNSQNSNIAILVNGVSQVYDNERTHPLERINVPVESIDRIEIIRGPMAVLYGSGAAFGVINIITNNVSDADKQSIASFTAGSLNTTKTTYRLAAKENDLKLVINAAHFKTDGLDNKFSDMMSPANTATLSGYGITDSNYSTKNLLGQESKYFGLSGSYNKWIFDFAYNETDVGVFLLVPPLSKGHNRTTINTSMMLGYKTEVSSIVDVDIKATYNTTDRSDLVEFIVAEIENSQIVNFNSLELEILSTITPSDNTIILAGLNYNTMSDLRDVIDAPAIGVINESFEKSDRTTWAVFSQITYQATESLSLIAGIRYEDLQPYQTNGISDGGLPSQSTFGETRGDNQSTSPRLAAIYAYNKHNVVKFLYGEANRRSDDTLNPEITKTTELNYIYSKNNFFTSISLFHNQHQDLVIKDLVFEGCCLVSKERNSGRVTTNGLELIINSELSENLFGEFSITVQDSVNENDKSLEVEYSPKAVAHAKLAYQNKNTSVSVLGRYVSSMEPLYDLTKSARIGNKIDEYVVFDFNIRQNDIYKGMYLNFKISNMFDEKIRYPNNTATNELLDRGTIGAERMYFATIGVNF